MRSLKARTTLNSAKFLVVLAVVLFPYGGTLRFWQAWVYLGLQAAWLTTCGHYFLKTDAALVERRLTQDEQGEKDMTQRVLIATLRSLGVATLVVAGLDHRFGWTTVQPALVAVACAMFAAGTVLVFAVFRENTYTSSIIEVDPRQKVIATGPYRALRHPFYAGTLLLGLATPPLLGSYCAAIFIPPAWALLVVRIFAEERFLSDRLPGYKEYLSKVRCRLIPGVW